MSVSGGKGILVKFWILGIILVLTVCLVQHRSEAKETSFGLEVRRCKIKQLSEGCIDGTSKVLANKSIPINWPSPGQEALICGTKKKRTFEVVHSYISEAMQNVILDQDLFLRILIMPTSTSGADEKVSSNLRSANDSKCDLVVRLLLRTRQVVLMEQVVHAQGRTLRLLETHHKISEPDDYLWIRLSEPGVLH